MFAPGPGRFVFDISNSLIMNRQKYIGIFSLFMLLFAISCTQEMAVNDPEKTEEGEYLSFILEHEFSDKGGTTRSSLSPATPEPSTRGEVPGDAAFNENLLDWENRDLHIFFFDYTNNDRCLFYPEPKRLSLSDNGTEKILKIKLIPGKEDEFDLFEPDKMFGVNTVMYIVVNSGWLRSDFMNEDQVKPLSDIQSMVVKANFNQVSGGALVPQKKFVMEAEQRFYVPVWENITTVTLKRIAAKIQMGLYNLSVDGYTANSAEVKLVNYTDRSPLSAAATSFGLQEEDYKSGDYLPVSLPALGTTPSTVTYAAPFYSYPTDWSDDLRNAAYLLLKVNWKNETTQVAKDYYYKIPLSSIPSDIENAAVFRHCLRRNYLYRYYLTITALGGDSPDSAVKIGGNLDVLGWGDEEVEMSIQKFDWLFVDEQDIVIYPVPGEVIQDYLIPYKSNSDLVLSVNPTAAYDDYTGGNMTRVPISWVDYGDNPDDRNITQYPYIDPNYMIGTQKYIRIRSRTPINCVPKDIYIKVHNEGELYAEINAIHYPALYVTAKGVSGGVSYTVTTLAITGDEQFKSQNYAGELNHKFYNIGSVFRKNSNGKFELIEDNEENAWVVSPKFTISYSSSSATEYRNDAIKHCQDSNEDGKSGWRLPTMAELYLIDKLQNDDNNALKDALVGGGRTRARAWAAGTWFLRGWQNSSGTIFQMREGIWGSDNKIIRDERNPIPNSSWGKHVPVCVRDVYQ